MENYPFISIVIPSKNNAKHIGKCLDSLFQQDYKGAYEIIVADAFSTDGTREIIASYMAKHENVKLVDGGAIGFARNNGVRQAKGEYVASINADCYAECSWLSELLKTFTNAHNKDARVVGVGGPNLAPNDDCFVSKAAFHAQNTLLGSGNSIQTSVFQEIRCVKSISTCNALFLKHALIANPFNGELCACDDADLNFRLREEGHRFVYTPTAIVYHYHFSGLTHFARKMFDYGVAMGVLTRLHKKLIRFFHVPLSAFFVLLFLSLFAAFLGNALFLFILLGVYSFALASTSLEVLFKTRNAVYALCAPALLAVQHSFYFLGFLKGLVA